MCIVLIVMEEKMKIRILSLLCFLFGSNFLYSEDIDIYHTSDVHGMYSSRAAKWDKENSTRTIGGFAAFKSLVSKDTNTVILIDSGDMFQGSPEGNTTKGLASINYMNMLGYSAAIVGNHDYDYGEENLKEIIKAANFPFLGANVYYKKDLKPVEYLKPWVIINKGGKKIAILGIIGEHTKTTTLPLNVSHLIIKDEAKEAEKYMEEINRENPDAVIILAHIGLDGNLSQKIVDVSTYTMTKTNHTTLGVARAAKTANVVLGGHIHAGLLNGYRDTQTGTLICESYYGLTHTTRIKLSFDDKTGKLIDSSCSLIPLWVDQTGEDSDVLSLTQKISSETAKKMDIVIGHSSKDINYESDTIDNSIGNFVTDITRWKAGADIGFQNSGGIRNFIAAGDVRLRDAYEVMPFENTIYRVKMKGSEIYDVIRENFRGNRTSMYISGIKVKYWLKDGIVSKIEIEKDGKPIEMDKIYTVATNNYLASGGSGGKTITAAKDKEDTMVLVRDAMIEWIKTQKEIVPADTGRFIKME